MGEFGTGTTVSVLVPCFNTPGRYLDEAIASALNQPVGLEVVIQDGGSDRPDTVASLEEWARHPRVSMESRPDAGQSEAFNRALARATGRYVVWLNADDWLAPDSLATLVEQLDDAELVEAAYGDFEIRDQAGGVVRSCTSGDWDYQRIMRRGCYIFSGSILFRKTALEGVGGLNTSLHYCMDLNLYLALGPEFRAEHVECTVGALRIHDESKTGSLGRRFAGEAFRVRRSHDAGLSTLLIAGRSYLTTRATVATTPIRYSKLYTHFRRERVL